MPGVNHVIRRLYSTLVAYDGPPATVYKLSQNDISRVEQAAGAALEFLPQPTLQAALNANSIRSLPLDAEDHVALTPLGYNIPADPTAAPLPARPSAPAARPVGVPPAPVQSPLRPAPSPVRPAAAPASAGPSTGPKLRGGLVAAVIVLGAAALLVIFLLSRLFSSPSSPPNTPTASTDATATLTATVAPDKPAATALANVSVRSGPDEIYPIIGILPGGNSALIVGRNQDTTWWLIEGDNIQGDQGWVPGERVQVQNADDVPVVAAPPLPTATPTPLQTFRGWKGEYFDNASLQGTPVAVQDDAEINFNWGSGAPAAAAPADNYSVRWSRQVFFEEGNYRFQITVQGGVRLWIDSRLLVNEWQNGPLRTIDADSGPLARGDHSLVVEYGKATGNGQIALSWQFQPGAPPTAAISGPATGLVGQPLTFDAGNSKAAPGHRIASIQWRFGDGAGSDQSRVDKVYQAAGDFDVTLIVTDDAGLTGVATQKVTITAPTPTPTMLPAPSAVINGPNQAIAGVAVTFDGSASAPAGGIASYRWDFGDGGAGSGPTVNHVFAQAGSYTVSLTVANAAGVSDRSSMVVQVAQPQPTSPAPLSLEGRLWTFQGADVGGPITVTFERGVIRGFSGCNTYEGTYSAAASTLAVGPLAVGSQTCDPAVMQQETAFLARLQVADEYEIEENQLRLSGTIGGESFRLIFLGNQ